MLKTLKNIIKTGDSTKKYPFEPLPEIEHSRGKPDHSLEKCIACAACAVACPADAIHMHADTNEGTISWEINFGRCIFCGRCEEACSFDAIHLSCEFELAVMNKDDLHEKCTYTLQDCNVCGKYFAPRKEVDYVVSLLTKGESNDYIEQAVETAHTCPACKRIADAKVAQNRVKVQKWAYQADDSSAKLKGETKSPEIKAAVEQDKAGKGE